MRGRVSTPGIALACLAGSAALADAADGPVVPAAAELPRFLTLDDTLGIWRAHGLDLLIAEAAVKSAEGSVRVAGAIANPVATATVANAFTYQWSKSSDYDCNSFGAVCTPWGYSFGLADSAAIEDTLSGKRDLRLKVARNALAAAKMSRVDATRTLGFQVRSAFVQVAQGQLALRFAREVAASQVTTLKKFQDRYRAGAISEGDLQRIEVTKLEADQAVDSAEQALRQARAALAFLLGVRGNAPDFSVDERALDYTPPAKLRGATADTLVHTAFDRRPDLLSSAYTLASADGQLQLVRRQKFPDITLGLTYQWGGTAGWSVDLAIIGPMLTLSLSAPLPVFYQLQGEELQAQAQRETALLQQARNTAQVANDVATGYAALDATMKLVERMEGPRRSDGGLLESAKGAFEIAAAQYDKGAASLTDYLDALRTFIATRNEYFGDLANYWTSVFQLEAAVGKELR
ncbi:MAG TPA: TolC family protein [Polyangia bacterium]|nr:TolC family protein [Polyangia bacterium]